MTEENHEDQPVLTQEQKDAAAAAKFREQQTPPADESLGGDADDDKPQRPEHIPEKFWDAEKGEVRVEELAKSYAELERAKAAPPKAEGDAGAAGAADDADLPPEVAQFKTTLTESIATARATMTEKLVAGQPLEDADYAPFEKVGISRDDIDFIIEGMQARGAQVKAEIHKEVGGEDAYTAMQEWARANLTKEEIAAYDHDVVQSNDRSVNLNAVRGLFARYQLATGRGSRDVTLQGDRRGTVSGYQSGAEMRADMASEKYQKDSGFRAQVAARVKAARAAGVDLSR